MQKRGNFSGALVVAHFGRCSAIPENSACKVCFTLCLLCISVLFLRSVLFTVCTPSLIVPPWVVRRRTVSAYRGLWYQIGAPWDAALLRFGALFARLEFFFAKGVDMVCTMCYTCANNKRTAANANGGERANSPPPAEVD